MRRYLLLLLSLALVLAAGTSVLLVRDAPSVADVAAPPTTGPAATPPATPSPTATGSPAADASPSPSPSDTEPTGPRFEYDIAGTQQRLADLRYYGGAIDGEEGPMMRAAVMAFQKVNGLSADGVVGPITLGALEAPVQPSPAAGAPSDGIEIDLTRQVLYWIEGGEIRRIMPVSSGSGDTYRSRSGGTARSLTPVGHYRVERRIRGLREAFLGSLYDPMYFYKGWAIHGSNNVPAYPASHGCVRVTRWDALWLFERAPVGTAVYVHGGQHTFTAGSSAPGTDAPAGDTPEDTQQPTPSPSPPPDGGSDPPPPDDPAPSESPTPEPSPQPSPSPSASPSPSPSPSGSPSPSPSESGLPTDVPTGSPSPGAS